MPDVEIADDALFRLANGPILLGATRWQTTRRNRDLARRVLASHRRN
jgi:hypothetical protein